MASPNVSAVLFAKDLVRVATFYRDALDMPCSFSDEHHFVLSCRGFTLIVHQIPQPLAVDIVIETPPQRRTETAIRLDYPVRDLGDSRRRAQSLGGGIDTAPPQWASREANFFYGYDPEGNQFGVTEQADSIRA